MQKYNKVVYQITSMVKRQNTRFKYCGRTALINTKVSNLDNDVHLSFSMKIVQPDVDLQRSIARVD